MNAKDADGRTPLIHAAINCDYDLAVSLLREGANADLADSNGFSALHFAAQNYCVKVAELLVEVGAIVDALDKYGNTPLWRAVFNARGRTALVATLLDAGASISQRNFSGVLPLDLGRTIGHPDIITLLRKTEQETADDV